MNGSALSAADLPSLGMTNGDISNDVISRHNRSKDKNMVLQYVYLNHDSSNHNELHLRDVEKPKIVAANEVLVRIRAVSLNYRDVRPRTLG
jgi:hypothetical protein